MHSSLSNIRLAGIAVTTGSVVRDFIADGLAAGLDRIALERTRGKAIKVGAAYERDFERFLVRMYLERQPEAVAVFLASKEAKALPAEGRMFAALALDPKVGGPLVAELVGQLDRGLGGGRADEGLLRRRSPGWRRGGAGGGASWY
jgi:hypothetical protein